MDEDKSEVEIALHKDIERSLALIVYAMFLFAVSIVCMCFDQQPVADVVLLGCAGGAFCQLWGLLGLFNQPFRFGATATLSVITLGLFWFSSMQWLPAIGDAPTRPLEKILTAAMALVTLALLGWLLLAQKEKEASRSEAKAGED
jgi:hypothetical protein